MAGFASPTGFDGNNATILKNRVMITTENEELVKQSLGKAFGFPTLHVSKGSRPNTVAMKFVVQKINGGQLVLLNQIAIKTGTDVELKRSGTGISIHFN